LQFLPDSTIESLILLKAEGVSDILCNIPTKREYFNKLIKNSSKRTFFKIPIIFNKDKISMLPIKKVMDNIYKKLKKLDLPFNEQYLNLNIFKYMTFLLAETCEIFEFSYAKYLFKLMKYSYISKELPRARHYCLLLEKFKEKLKNPTIFSLWKAKIQFISGNYMEAIKVLKNSNKTMIKCRLKLFKYYLKSEFYSKNSVISMFQGFLKEFTK